MVAEVQQLAQISRQRTSMRGDQLFELRTVDQTDARKARLSRHFRRILAKRAGRHEQAMTAARNSAAQILNGATSDDAGRGVALDLDVQLHLGQAGSVEFGPDVYATVAGPPCSPHRITAHRLEQSGHQLFRLKPIQLQDAANERAAVR